MITIFKKRALFLSFFPLHRTRGRREGPFRKQNKNESLLSLFSSYSSGARRENAALRLRSGLLLGSGGGAGFFFTALPAAPVAPFMVLFFLLTPATATTTAAPRGAAATEAAAKEAAAAAVAGAAAATAAGVVGGRPGAGRGEEGGDKREGD